MTAVGRRRFFAMLGAAIVAGCTDAADNSTPTASGLLAGVTFEVRRDPG